MAGVPHSTSELCSIRRVGDVVVAVGEVDAANADWVRDRIGEETGVRVLDWSGVRFCSAAGISVLLDLGRSAAARGAVLELVCPSSLRRLLRLSLAAPLAGIVVLPAEDHDGPHPVETDEHL